MTFSFLPADIVSQILNFGLPAPIDIQIVGYNIEGNREFADKLLAEVRQVPGTVDLHIQQPFDEPYLHINVDRTKAQLVGFTQRDVATNLLISLSGSFQTTPEFWLNPKTGVSYAIATQTPQYQLDSLQDLENIPVTGPAGGAAGNPGQPGFHPARRGNGPGVALRHSASARYLRLGPGTRPGWRGDRHKTNCERTRERTCRAGHK